MKLVILLCLVTAVLGYTSGPPVNQGSLCTDMIPTGHNSGVSNAADKDNPPYIITTSAGEYSPGGSLTVTITGTGDNQFEGFFIQARRADSGRDTDVAIGTFSSPPATTQLLMCHTVANSAWGHSNNDARDTIVGTWTAPGQDEGPLEFKATIVKGDPDRSYFYTNVTSAQLTFTAAATGMVPTAESGTDPAGGMPGTTPSGGSRLTVSTALACLVALLAAVLAARQI